MYVLHPSARTYRSCKFHRIHHTGLNHITAGKVRHLQNIRHCPCKLHHLQCMLLAYKGEVLLRLSCIYHQSTFHSFHCIQLQCIRPSPPARINLKRTFHPLILCIRIHRIRLNLPQLPSYCIDLQRTDHPTLCIECHRIRLNLPHLPSYCNDLQRTHHPTLCIECHRRNSHPSSIYLQRTVHPLLCIKSHHKLNMYT